MGFKRMATIVSVRRLFRQTGCNFVSGFRVAYARISMLPCENTENRRQNKISS
jgi:hypothetical protein